MNRNEFADFCRDRVVVLDGATGSNMAKKGMPRDCCPEAWLLEHQDLAAALQREYAQAGSQIVYAPTFQANRISLKKHGLADQIERLNTGLVAMTKKAVGEHVLVAGDLTTTGELLEPLGEMPEEELYEAYREQVMILEQAGADLLVAETMLSVQETAVALKAALENTSLPMMCTLTVSEDGRALFGGTAVEAVEQLGAMGASAVGVNCSLGPNQMTNVVKDMCHASKVPVIVKPNAGLPVISGSGEAIYQMEAAEFVEGMKKLIDLGAGLVGGCCGTTPEFISQLTAALGR